MDPYEKECRILKKLWEEVMSDEEPFANNDSSDEYSPSSEESDCSIHSVPKKKIKLQERRHFISSISSRDLAEAGTSGMQSTDKSAVISEVCFITIYCCALKIYIYIF